METVIKISQLLVALSLLVIVHELGHFMFAKLFKCRVEKFYLFFDYKFSLFKFRKGETEYGIGWIPLGGYVKISGMVDESMDKEQLKKEPQPWEYRSKPAWQRFFIIIGGVFMNAVLAIAIYIGMSIAWGDAYVKNSDVEQGYAFSETAQKMGFQNGDKVLFVDNVAVESYAEVPKMILLGDEREVVVARGGDTLTITITDSMLESMLHDRAFISLRYPYSIAAISEGSVAERTELRAGDTLVSFNGVPYTFLDEYKELLASHKGDSVELGVLRDGALINLIAITDTTGLLGVNVNIDLAANYNISVTEYNIIEAIPAGFNRGIEEIGNYVKQLKVIFNPDTGAYKEVGGFIAMGKIFPSEWSWYAFWNITALFSIMLAVLNILPIPVFDGGHLVFILYEMITRRAPSQKFMEVSQYIGFIFILTLLIFANGNDILKLFN